MNNEFDAQRAKFKRWSLRLGGYGAWVIGAIFSYIGFTSESVGSTFWKALGIGLTLLVTVLELWLNDTKVSDLLSDKSTFGDILLFLGGCLSYVYDAYTSVLGLCVLMLGITHPDISKMEWSQWLIPVLGGIFLAALPEPMVVASYKNEPKKKVEQVQNKQVPTKHIQYQQKPQQKYTAQHKPTLGPVNVMPTAQQNSCTPWPPESGYLQASQRGEN